MGNGMDKGNPYPSGMLAGILGISHWQIVCFLLSAIALPVKGHSS